MSKSTHDILIVKQGDSLSASQFEVMLEAGHRTQTASNPNEAAASIGTLISPILILDAGNDEERGYEFVKSIIDTNALHQYPLIVIGKDVDAYETALGRYFSFAGTIVAPFTNADLLNAISTVERVLAAKKTEATPTGVTSQEMPIVDLDPTPEHLIHESFKKFESIPQAIFAQYEELNLYSRSLGGGGYTHQITEEQLKREGIMPPDPATQMAVKELTESLGEWCTGHLYRVAYMTSKITNALGLPADVKEYSKTAALLYCWSFLPEDRPLLRQSYVGQRNKPIRDGLTAKLHQSALKAEQTLANPKVSDVVTGIANLIGRTSPAEESSEAIVGSAIMAADLIDRSCFVDGHWDPRPAYTILSRLKKGAIQELHPAVLACVIKLLSEAVSVSSRLVLPKSQRENTELNEEAKKTEESVSEVGELKVPLTNLAPGMKLTKPLRAFDGREILSADLILDQDIIWRIWQLAALRPINGPATVRNVTETRSQPTSFAE